ncbi:MAG: permease, partial [Anaerolineae bacterium]
CSTVDSFLALAFVNTFTTGAIIAFLSFGPMVDVKSALMFLGVFTRRTVFYLILLPFVFNLLAGVVINLMLGYR